MSAPMPEWMEKEVRYAREQSACAALDGTEHECRCSQRIIRYLADALDKAVAESAPTALDCLPSAPLEQEATRDGVRQHAASSRSDSPPASLDAAVTRCDECRRPLALDEIEASRDDALPEPLCDRCREPWRGR